MPKILIIRLSSMGDIILTTPVLRCIKEQIPHAQIHFLVKHKFKDAINTNIHISKIYTFNGDLRKVTNVLRKEKYDMVIDLHNNIRSSYIKMKLDTKSYTYNKSNIYKWLYTTFRINKMPTTHIVDRYMEAVKPLGVLNDHKGLDYHIRDKDKIDIQTLPPEFHQGYISFAIGGTFATKRLPKHKIISIINKLNKPVVLLGGEDDHAHAYEIESKSKNKVYNACGKYKLGHSASIIQQSLYVISHDTGLMHIAAALNKPMVSVWGNTVPEFGMTPFYGESTVAHEIFEVKGLSCRPCSKIGFNSCPKKHFKCMENIETSKIANLINQEC